MSRTIEECRTLWDAACELQACAARESPDRLREASVKKLRIAEHIIPLMADSTLADSIFEEQVKPELDLLWASISEGHQ